MSDQTNYSKLAAMWSNRTFTQVGHRNPDGHFHFNRQRKLPDVTGSKTVNKVVIHTSEQKPDFNPPDDGAEWLNRYQLDTKRSASWHCSLDTDSVIWALPESYRAWHIHRISNSSVGVELATKAHLWPTLDPVWRLHLLGQAARIAAFWCVGLNIPTRYITKSEVDSGASGITMHGWNDPSRRSDPGVKGPGHFTTFPHSDFLLLVKDFQKLWAGGGHPILKDSTVLHQLLMRDLSNVDEVDKSPDKKLQSKLDDSVSHVTDRGKSMDTFVRSYLGSEAWSHVGNPAIIKMVQTLVGSRADGIVGPKTRAAVRRWLDG